MSNLSPKEIVNQLDKYIIGQNEAKRAMAIALRNRYRRSKLDKEMQSEITPKNIIMVGPTGVGKTEIARRLAALVDAPFVKVEATKFTEVGYVGRDVESMIRDLVEASIRLVKSKKMEIVILQAQTAAQERLVDILMPGKKYEKPNQFFLTGTVNKDYEPEENSDNIAKRQEIITLLNAGKLDDIEIEIEVDDTPMMGMEIAGIGADFSLNDMFGAIFPKKRKMRKVKVSEAKRILEQEEADKLIDMDEVTREAVERAEQDGIIFLDEIDKIAGKNVGNGPDVSREGVQRDILPIVEGSIVMTKYGPVKTDYMLFVAAGAFHVSKVSDLIPELQGRFPIRVNLSSLTQADLRSILTKPQNAIVKQYTALMQADGINLEFSNEALDDVAEQAMLANETSENIGARRLQTIMENLLDDIAFMDGSNEPISVAIDREYVQKHFDVKQPKKDLQKYIL